MPHKNKYYRQAELPLPDDLFEIYTTGHPRSGSTWLNRLLSDLLSSPLQTKPGEVAEYFGKYDGGGYVIRKKHILSDKKPETGKVVFIQRDPRDVVVSALYYRCHQPTPDSLMRVLRTLCEPRADPRYKVYHDMGKYERFVRSWTDTDLADVKTKYEYLQKYPLPELRRVVFGLTGVSTPVSWIIECFERQKFDQWAPDYPHSMRKGIAGDWKNHFLREHGEYITEHLGSLMLEQGYIDDLDWWKGLPE